MKTRTSKQTIEVGWGLSWFEVTRGIDVLSVDQFTINDEWLLVINSWVRGWRVSRVKEVVGGENRRALLGQRGKVVMEDEDVVERIGKNV